MLSESLRVPYRADDAFGTILVGSVLTLLSGVLLAVWIVLLSAWPPVGLALTPVVVLPSLVIRGYLLGVVKSGIRNERTVPSFVRWGSLVRAGVTSTLISALYALPAAVLAGLAVGGGVATVVSPAGFDETMQALTGVLIMVAGFGLLIYGLVYLYVRPAARAAFASTGSLRAALRVRRVLRLAATEEYLSGWLIAMGLLTVGPTLLVPLVVIAAIVGLLSPVVAVVIVLVTILLGIVLGYVVRVSAAWSTGRGGATGLAALFPTATSSPTASDAAGIVLTERVEADLDGDRQEVDPLVQTGRTVEASQPESQTGEPGAMDQSTPAETPETPETAVTEAESKTHNESEPLDNPADRNASTAEPAESVESAESAEPAEPVEPAEPAEPADHEDDKGDGSGFVWGVDTESDAE